ncbi:MAG: type VI secretion system contractile sheath small subunit [bacterium]|nr:type VI secretion system contractile sheath small subunit [bacterium]
MGNESVYGKKERVRPPRVHISYEVDLNGAMQMKELPFVVGVMADLSGNPAVPLPKPMDRKFTDIDRDNFDDILGSMKPRLAYKVENKLADDGSELSVELNFSKMSDFSPDAVVRQVKPLNDLIEVRTKLKALLSRTEGNDRLEELLEAIMENSEMRDKLKGVLGAEGPGAGQED